MTGPAPPPHVPRYPRAVLFDLDDTIFDHSLTCRDALGRVRREFDVFRGPSLDDLRHEYGRLLTDTHRGVMLGHRTSEEARAERFRRLAEWAGHPIRPSAALEVSEAYRAHYQRLRRAVPGAAEAVRRLARRSLIGIVTNNTVAEQEEKLAFLALDRTVDLLVTSEEVGSAKPDRRIFCSALARAGTTAGETVMIGDSWESDITGARAAGIRAIWFNRFRVPRPGPETVGEFRSFRPARDLASLVAVA